MRWSTPGMRSVAQSNQGKPLRTMPRRKMTAERRSTRASTGRSRPSPARRPNESGIDTPTMKRKKGKTRSVGVQPCQSAWRSGGYTARQVPGLFTSTMAATVIPRRASSERSRATPLPYITGACNPRSADGVLAGAEHDLAELLGLFHPAVSGGRLRERKHAVHHRAQAALAVEREHGRELARAPHGGSQHGDLTPEQVAQHVVLERTGGGAVGGDAPAGPEDLDGADEGGAAHAVDRHVGPGPAGLRQ